MATGILCPVWMHQKPNKIHSMALLTVMHIFTPYSEKTDFSYFVPINRVCKEYSNASEFRERHRWLSKYYGWKEHFAMVEQRLVHEGLVHSFTRSPHSASARADLCDGRGGGGTREGSNCTHCKCENYRFIAINTEHKTESPVKRGEQFLG